MDADVTAVAADDEDDKRRIRRGDQQNRTCRGYRQGDQRLFPRRVMGGRGVSPAPRRQNPLTAWTEKKSPQPLSTRIFKNSARFTLTLCDSTCAASAGLSAS